MDTEQSNPYFLMFEKRRLKVAEMHRKRREDLFNRSRQILQLNENQDRQQNQIKHNPTNSNQSHQDTLCNKNQQPNMVNLSQQQQSSLTIKSQDEFFIQQKQVPYGLNSMGSRDQTEVNDIQYNNTQMNNQKPKKPKKYNNKYSKIVQTSSWMNTIPQELEKFYCMARPNGTIGLLVFSQGCIGIYSKFGKKDSYFKIHLNWQPPVGSSQEAIPQSLGHFFETKSIHITDLLYWKYTIMTVHAWLMANTNQLINTLSPILKIRLVQYYLLNEKASLQKLYFGKFEYQKQGLLFVHKQSLYIHGLNENVLIWKDSNTSKYPINKASNLLGKAQQQISQQDQFIYGTGRYTRSGFIYTLDGYKLGHINPIDLPCVQSGYVKFRLKQIKFNMHSENTSNSMEIQSQKNQALNVSLVNFEVISYKKFGESRSSQVRYDPLTIQSIANRIH